MGIVRGARTIDWDKKLQKTTGSLQDIGTEFGSDKFTVHHFGTAMEQYFEPVRNKPLNILEIGIGEENMAIGGASLKTWAAYFPNARIVGIDIYDKSALDSDRIITGICDQSDQNTLIELSRELGPFDIVIDDGSHMAEPTLLSLFALLPTMRPGGLYVIEDIQTSYWPHYGGTSILGDILNTPVFWMKRMIDVINSPEILWDKHPTKLSGFLVEELHIHHNIAFIRRGTAAPVSSVLNEEIRAEWLKSDFAKHQISETFARKFSSNGEFRLKVAALMSELAED